jgi:hypothetical protein
MKPSIIKTVAAIIMTATVAFAEEAPQDANSIVKTLLTATESGNYSEFQQQGDPAFQAGITKDMFSKVSEQLAPVLKGGYDLSFLTSLTQQGYNVYLWKITPKTGKDQFVAKLVVKNGKASGFWIQ